MYLGFEVKIPNVKGKIIFRSKNGVEYVYYEYNREYNRTTQKTNPKRALIGKRIKDDPQNMLPNTNFLMYFPDTKLPEKYSRSERSNCLKLGGFLVVRKIFEELKLSEVLGDPVDSRLRGVFLDVTAFYVLAEALPGERYSDYAYCHPLFTQDMHILTESEMTEALCLLQEESREAFFRHWGILRQELSLCGFDRIRTAEVMSAKQALEFCEGTGEADRLFPARSALWDEEAFPEETIYFIRLIALIVRNRIYDRLKEQWIISGQGLSGFSLAEILRELEKLEMVRLTDNRYHQANALTDLQTTAFRSFGIDAKQIRYWAKEIRKILSDPNSGSFCSINLDMAGGQ